MAAAISQVNWLGVLAASVAHFVLGGVWFVALFGKQYAAALGIADRPPTKPPTKPSALFIVGPFVCSAVTLASTAILMRALGISALSDALVLGVIVAVGYLVPMTINIAINPLFPRPFHYALINAPFFLLGSVLGSAILFALA